VVAVTGTNGKSTTTALIAHILRSAGRDVQMGGNIGTAILSLAPPAPDRIHVIEMSSFQIDLAPSLAPTVGVLLNVSADHLDRHATLEHYAAIKERLIANADASLVGIDDDISRAFAKHRQDSGREHWPLSNERQSRGYFADGTKVCFADGQPQSTRIIADLTGITTLRGRHNAQNAAAAAGAASLLGVPAAIIAKALRTFPGLPHRLEEIGRVGRTLFINDSKATNADSTEKALASFERGIFWILGGRAKEGGITALEPYFSRIAKAYLIGESSEPFAATLAAASVSFARCDTLDRAVAAAAADAAASSAPEPVVLLSPACASYDQFKSFEHRGDAFRTLVAVLPGIAMKAGASA
jgi:UDP-N-acetylmuramoylalanine--D-glutamate ligase